jgi:acyl carrier protein
MSLDREQVRVTALEVLRGIAPEIEAGDIKPARPLRSQVDLDSMDWLNFLIAVHQRFGVEIAESDYATLDTLDRICEFVAAKNPQLS